MNDDIWVLSIPSFKWTKLTVNGQTGMSRMSHSCFMPYPNQVIVIGGQGANRIALDQARAVDVFDINELQWTGRYDPTEWTSYIPPQALNDSEVATYRPSNMSDGLRTALGIAYDTERTQTFYPYTPLTTQVTPPSAPSPTPNPTPGYVVPVAATLGTVGGLAILGAIIFCCRRHRRNKQRLTSHRESTSTAAAGHTPTSGWIDKWRRTAATSIAPKALSDTVTETDGAASPNPQAMSETTYRNSTTNPSELADGYFPRGGRPPIYEIDSSDVHEVHGRSSSGNIHDHSHHHDRDPDLDPRRFPMYPPSVVSGAGNHSRNAEQDLDDSSVSHVTAATGSPRGHSSTTAAATMGSPTASASSPRSSPGVVPIASIPEAAAFSLNGHHAGSGGGGGGGRPETPQESLARELSQRAVSPVQSEGGGRQLQQQQRPGHRRHNSSMSSGFSPLPSPGREEDLEGGHGHTL